MGATAAVSAAAFTVVLGETFAAIGASTIVPATLIAGLKAAKGATDDAAEILDSGALKAMGGQQLKPILDALSKGLAHIDSLPLLVPHDAKLHAEFQFEAREAYEMEMGAGAQVEVVTVHAGYSALYEAKSSNKITLDMNFVTVDVALGGPAKTDGDAGGTSGGRVNPTPPPPHG